MKAIKFENDSVLIKSGKIEAWVDVIVKNGDVHCEWNKYIFYKENPLDMKLRTWQDNSDNFDDATSLAIQTLEKAKIIYQDNKGNWHKNY